MYKAIRLFALGMVAILAASCVTQKQITYLQDVDGAKGDSIKAHFVPQTETIIRSGDALTVFVSALDKEAVAPYNLPVAVFATPGSTQVQTTPMLQYYMVDEAGDIELPVLGKVHVAGLKRPEVEEAIKKKLEAQIVNPLVQVNLIGAKVSVMGEVARPGHVGMAKGRITILEALAAAGDLTPYGRRDNVLVTREVDLYTSPYYYLQQNDVIYVSPNSVRAINSTNAGLWLSVVSTALSAATVIVTVVKK